MIPKRKNLRDVTQQEFNSGNAFIETSFGKYMISGVNEEWWVMCPKANGGFGRSFSCYPGTQILIEDNSIIV